MGSGNETRLRAKMKTKAPEEPQRDSGGCVRAGTCCAGKRGTDPGGQATTALGGQEGKTLSRKEWERLPGGPRTTTNSAATCFTSLSSKGLQYGRFGRVSPHCLGDVGKSIKSRKKPRLTELLGFSSAAPAPGGVPEERLHLREKPPRNRGNAMNTEIW